MVFRILVLEYMVRVHGDILSDLRRHRSRCIRQEIIGDIEPARRQSTQGLIEVGHFAGEASAKMKSYWPSPMARRNSAASPT